jgi:hypothetical protein
MSTSLKIEQIGAFQLEAGKTGAGQSPGWGQSGSVEALGANDAYPWFELKKGKTVGNVQDNSITNHAFKDVSRKTSEYVEQGWATHLRFDGLNALLYWCFGFENSIVKVGVFALSAPTIEPVAGATYRDTDLNDFTFMRKETSGGTTYYVFRCDDSTVPTLGTGDLTKQAGTGDATLTFSAHSDLMYEHLYELDAHERHFMAYRTAEQITGYAAGDKKNRMATIGVKMGTNDYRYPNAMCKGFELRSQAAAFAELGMDFCAYDEERGDYDSDTWTFPTTRDSTENIVVHHQTAFEIGASESALVALGITSFNLKCGVPLQVLQDTLSGTHIAEPVMEGKYETTLESTISRYAAETYQTYRDAWTSVVARISAVSGYYMQEVLVQEAKLPQAGPTDDDVAQENLNIVLGSDAATNAWSTWLYGNTLIQNGPIVLRIRNTDSVNHMFEI